MYRINHLNRSVLITVDEVIFHAATDAKVDARQIMQNIITAEERWIANTLGDKFYEDFMNKKNVVVTDSNKADLLTKINASLTAAGVQNITLTAIPNGTIINAIELVTDEWYVKLWNRFLWKLTAECVDISGIVPSWVRTTSSGQQQNNPNVIGGNGSGSATAGLKEVQFKMSSAIQDRIDPLIERMILWICQNKTHFPLFEKACGDCDGSGMPDGVSHVRKTNFITNIYNDYDERIS